MRRLITAAAMTAILVLPPTAHAASGWAPFRGHFVRYHTTLSKPSDAIAGDWMLYLQDRARAIKRAKRANVRWAAFLAAQEALRTAPAPSGGYAPAAPYVPSGPVNWDAIAMCESGGRWDLNTGNSYFGGLQENMDFWTSYGGLAYAARPDLATREEQVTVAERAYATRGLSPWPVCGVYG